MLILIKAKTFLPECKQGENPREQGLAYEEKIRQKGGVDLQILRYWRKWSYWFQ